MLITKITEERKWLDRDIITEGQSEDIAILHVYVANRALKCETKLNWKEK
jgi:hypothetical protein